MHDASLSEYTYFTPRVFQRPGLEFVRYNETRRASGVMLSGNVASSPAIINEKNYQSTKSTLQYEAWAEQETTRANARIEQLRQSLGLARFALLRAMHGTHVIDASIHMDEMQASIPLTSRPVADSGYITKSGDGIMINPADCVVANVAWPSERVVAQVHSGIRGMVQEAIPKAFHTFSELGLRASDAVVYLSPYARQYKASDRAKDEMEAMVTANSDEVAKEYRQFTYTPLSRPEGTLVNQEGFAHAQLIRSGVIRDNIAQSVHNTLSEPDLFSHYKAKTTGVPNGRIGVAIGIASHKKQ